MSGGPVLQSKIPEAQRVQASTRLPGMVALGDGGWLVRDEVFAEQLALKARLIAQRRGDVLAVLPGAEAAVAELYSVVLAALSADPGYRTSDEAVVRPDGAVVIPDASDPLLTLSQLVQEDLCVLEKRGDEHVLVAALLCFPAAWTLAEKIGRPLLRIHAPVRHYDGQIAQRVQRLFDGVRAGRPMWRANLLRYDNPALYQPHLEATPRPVGRDDSPFERSERQTVLRLPVSGAVLFAIHTAVTAAVRSSSGMPGPDR